MMLSIAVGLLVVLMMSAALRFTCQKLFSPAGITVSVWFAVFFSGLLFQGDFSHLDERTLFLWMLWFLISCAIYLFFSQRTNWAEIRRIHVLPFNYGPLLFGLIVVLLYKAWLIGSAGPAHFFYNLRLSATGGEDVEALGWITRFYPLVYALFIYETLYESRSNRYRRMMLWSWMLIYAIATMGKFAILTPFVTWLIIKNRAGRVNYRMIVGASSAALTLMLVAHFLRSSEDDVAGFFSWLSIYIYSPIVAFGRLDAFANDDFGTYTLRLVHAIHHYLFSGKPPAETILPYVHIPYPTNVYTVMQPFYTDFSAFGVVLGALLYGFVFGLSYRSYHRGDLFGMLLYSGLAVSLITQFLTETLVTNLSGTLQFVAACAFIAWLSKENRHVR